MQIDSAGHTITPSFSPVSGGIIHVLVPDFLDILGPNGVIKLITHFCHLYPCFGRKVRGIKSLVMVRSCDLSDGEI